MATLSNILNKEATNQNAIYLYEQEDRWFAYECSAYLFSLIFKMGEIEQVDDCIRVAISNQFELLHSEAMCSVETTSVADDEVVIVCKIANTGFKKW